MIWLTEEYLICWHCWCCPPPQRGLCRQAGEPEREKAGHKCLNRTLFSKNPPKPLEQYAARTKVAISGKYIYVAFKVYTLLYDNCTTNLYAYTGGCWKELANTTFCFDPVTMSILNSSNKHWQCQFILCLIFSRLFLSFLNSITYWGTFTNPMIIYIWPIKLDYWQHLNLSHNRCDLISKHRGRCRPRARHIYVLLITIKKLREIENTDLLVVFRKSIAGASLQITIRCAIVIEIYCVAAW